MKRLSADVKSALCKTLKWDLKDGTFALYVPAVPETRSLRDWLWKRGTMAQYHAPGGGVTAWQWRLKFGENRAVWAAKGERLDG